jgi:hypothetical protein
MSPDERDEMIQHPPIDNIGFKKDTITVCIKMTHLNIQTVSKFLLELVQYFLKLHKLHIVSKLRCLNSLS